MKKLLKIFNVVLAMIMCLSLFTFSASAASKTEARYSLPFDVNAEAYVLVSLDTGEVIFEKNSNQQYIPASLTKLLTVYTAYQYIDDLDNTMITAPAYIYDELFGMGGSTADIRKGETLSAKELIYAAMLPSANEAASILADYVGKGSIDNFCMMMNNEAKKLGCTNTNFTNPHGLFIDNHYTSAYDMYLIAKALYETPGFMEIAETVTHKMPDNPRYPNGWFIQSTVRMQSRTSPYYRSYVSGMKTGSLNEIGHNFVTVCKNNGESYILVVIGAKKSEADPSPAFTTTAQIMDYFFETYSMRSANTLTFPVTDIPLKYASDTDTLLLYADTEVMSVLPNDADETSFQKVYNLPDSVSAPIHKGDAIGTVDYFLAGQKVGTSQLISNDDIERSMVMFLVGKFQEAYQSLYFRVVLAVTATLIVAYVIYTYIQYKKYEKMNKVHRRRR